MMTSLVICDWLDVTARPDSEIPDNVLSFISRCSTDFSVSGNSTKECVTAHFLDGGTVRIDKRRNHSRVSASGSALAYFRAHKMIDEYLDILGSSPHNVTRLDAAHDTPEDGAAVFSRLKRKYKNSPVMLTRKGLKAKFVSEFRDSDGKETGSFYAGHRTKASVTACVYDKALEILERTGATDGEALSRYELRVRSNAGPTLRDAAEPSRIFWHFMSPALIKKPKGLIIDPWSSGWGGGWVGDAYEPDPAAKIRFMVDSSAMLDRMLIIADELGPNGRTYLRSLINKRLQDSS